MIVKRMPEMRNDHGKPYALMSCAAIKAKAAPPTPAPAKTIPVLCEVCEGALKGSSERPKGRSDGEAAHARLRRREK